MSKKITHEHIRKITQKYLLNSGESYLIDLGNQIINYITQQEKQQKLLELYRKLSVIRNDLLSYCEVFDGDYDDFEYIETDLEKQIKELQNEKI